jgi:uncharacterized protein DUF6912
VQRRVYLPLAEGEVRRLGSTGALDSVPLTGYAVTAELRRRHPGMDEEELEYLAFSDAARSDAAPVVAAADLGADVLAERELGGERVSSGGSVSQVQVSAPVLRRQMVSFHVAEASAASGDGGIPEFSWYDATELDVVVGLLRP